MVPAVLAAGWAAIVANARGASWIAFGAAAGLVGLSLAAVDAALLPAFGREADMTAGPVVLILLLAWTVGAPVAATRLPRHPGKEPAPLSVLIAGIGLWLIGVLVGLGAIGIVLPAGS